MDASVIMDIDMHLTHLLGNMTLGTTWRKTDIKGKRRATADITNIRQSRRTHVRLIRHRGLDLPIKPVGVLKIHRDRKRAAALRLRSASSHPRASLCGPLPHHWRRVPGGHLHSPRGVLRLPSGAPHMRAGLQRPSYGPGAAGGEVGQRRRCGGGSGFQT